MFPSTNRARRHLAVRGNALAPSQYRTPQRTLLRTPQRTLSTHPTHWTPRRQASAARSSLLRTISCHQSHLQPSKSLYGRLSRHLTALFHTARSRCIHTALPLTALALSHSRCFLTMLSYYPLSHCSLTLLSHYPFARCPHTALSHLLHTTDTICSPTHS